MQDVCQSSLVQFFRNADQLRDNMPPDDERWSRGLWLRTADAEFAHAVIERRAIHSESCSGAGWTADYPTCFAEYAQDVIAFDGFERG